MRTERFAAGEFVEARGRRWLVDAVLDGSPERHRLVCVDDDAQGEAIEACLDAEICVRRPSADVWEVLAETAPSNPHALGAHLRTTEWRTASAADRELFQAPFRAGIRLDAYQLLPLQRALALPRANLLIADDVGLGKTVEAGLVARELLLRRRIDTIVVAAPASMVLQWQDEMSQKFGLDFTIVDREHLLHTRRTRGFAANPWAVGSLFILSHSVLANEGYVGPLRAMLGDFRPRSLFILDEAHHAAPSAGSAYATESQMTKAVRDLSGRFEHRLFLSATPHNGHSNSFATLLEILDPQRFTRGIEVAPADLEPVMVRRLKEDLRRLGEPFPERQVEWIVIDGLPADAPELELAKMLAEYWAEAGGGAGGRFLLAVLQQRLFSSLTAFQRTLRAHRRGLLAKGAMSANASAAADDAFTGEAQTVDEREDSELVLLATRAQMPGGVHADSIARVDSMLRLTDAHASAPDARVGRILQWIGTEMLEGTAWRDRRLIVFTEWEDTRRWLVRCLEEGLTTRGVEVDGRIAVFTGLTSLDERDRIKRAFNAPFGEEPMRIPVCTDAAREGINLQARCHDLVHFDLPWNPSRLEQRNGRIDRKLQPSRFVTCRYFSYAQREEDRVLDALIAKTEIIRRELGPAGQVIRDEVEDQLRSGIARGAARAVADEIAAATSPRTATAARELGGDDERLERLKKQEERLADARERARKRVGVNPDNLRSVIELSLANMGTALRTGDFSVKGAVSLDPADPAFAGDTSWQALIDELRPGRPPHPTKLAEWRENNPPRGLVFSPPVLGDGQPEPQDVVQLHLEHRLVKRLVSRFIAQGFQETLDRVAVVRGAGAQPRVVLVARIALYGPGARRLHEEIIPVTARWRDTDRATRPLEPFGASGEATTIEQLHAALQDAVMPGEGVRKRLAEWVARDLEDLRPHVEARAEEARARAAIELGENGAREANELRELLERQLRRIERERIDYQPLQASFDLRSDEEREREKRERRQREADRQSWDGKIERLRADLESEPVRVRESYEVRAERLEPIGLVYLWPGN